MKTRTEQLKTAYRLEAHPEGGWFAEVYTAPFEKDGRALAGSIYFLLDAGEQSQFHQIDCEELWFYHEGCGVDPPCSRREAGRERRFPPTKENREKPPGCAKSIAHPGILRPSGPAHDSLSLADGNADLVDGRINRPCLGGPRFSGPAGGRLPRHGRSRQPGPARRR